MTRTDALNELRLTFDSEPHPELMHGMRIEVISDALLRGTTDRHPHLEFAELCELVARSYGAKGFPGSDEILRHPATPGLMRFLLAALMRYHVRATANALNKTSERHEALAAAFGVSREKRSALLEDLEVKQRCLAAGAAAYRSALGDRQPASEEQWGRAYKKAVSAAFHELCKKPDGRVTEPNARTKREQRSALAALLHAHGYRP